MLKHYKENKNKILLAFKQNYLYGLTGVMIPVAVWVENVFVLAIALYGFYTMLSVVVNREKYTTNLGKYFYFPLPAMLGGITSYILGQFIKTIL